MDPGEVAPAVSSKAQKGKAKHKQGEISGVEVEAVMVLML